MASLVETKTYHRGEILLLQGYKPESIVIITEGRVYKVKHQVVQEATSATLLKEKPCEQEFLGPGDTIALELVDDYYRR